MAAAGSVLLGTHGQHAITEKERRAKTSRKDVTQRRHAETSPRDVKQRRHAETWGWDESDQREAHSRDRGELGDRGSVRPTVRRRRRRPGPLGPARRPPRTTGGRARYEAPGDRNST